MYAIHVEEPGGEPSSYILPTGARTSESAMQLMSHRAEEYVDEQLEMDQAEDYTIVPGNLTVGVIRIVGDTPETVIKFTATALDQVV
ncbi:hypothetical protein D3C80_659930 [compost metagenome]